MVSYDDFTIPENTPLDRETQYNGTTYKIVEFLSSDLLLVVNKDKYNAREFPLISFVIPNNIEW